MDVDTTSKTLKDAVRVTYTGLQNLPLFPVPSLKKNKETKTEKSSQLIHLFMKKVSHRCA